MAQVEPEVVIPEPVEFTEPELTVEPASAVDAVETDADPSAVAHSVEEPLVNFEDILAHEGLLEPTGDEVVDQAIAFLNHDAPLEAAAPQTVAHVPGAPETAIAAESQYSDASAPEVSQSSVLLPEPEIAAAQDGAGR